jgi:hypothetical protein
MNSTKQQPPPSETLTPTLTFSERDRIILQDQIQTTFNRIQYDRSIVPDQRRGLEISLEELEKEYVHFFGEDRK